jgi:hypothetical protein
VHAFRVGSRLQFQLQDILAVTVGYGLATLYFRAFWPDQPPSAVMGIAGLGLYLWLGMAMSGPITLLRRRPRALRSFEPGQRSNGPPTYTWAELAWLLIGTYWIVLGLFVIRARLPDFMLGDMVLFGLIPFIVALALRVFGPSSPGEHESKHTWTHTVAVVLVVTWPIAWISLIVLGKTVR